jgi:hypothetical protein
MTDRELLEAAAKAADLDTLFEMYGWNEIGDGAFMDANEPPTLWNPLTDDGDALRLAVRLRLEVDAEHDPVCVGHCGKNIGVREPCGDDPYAATRRAIVRAAAAMVQE